MGAQVLLLGVQSCPASAGVWSNQPRVSQWQSFQQEHDPLALQAWGIVTSS